MKDKKLLYLLGISSLTYFCQGIEGLPSQGLQFYLKNLGWNEAKVMGVLAYITLAWSIKPIISTLIDNYFTKRSWMLFSLLTSILFSLVLGIWSLPIPIIIGLMFLTSTNAAVRDIANDGQMCEYGKETSTTGMIQSVQWISVTLAGIITGIGGGYITEHYGYKLGFLCLVPFYLIMFWVISKYKETKIKKAKIDLKEIIRPYKIIFTNKLFLTAMGFLFLYRFAPSVGTAFYYIQTDKFKWSQTFIGSMDAIASVFAILGALIYYKLSKQINIKKWLFISVFLGALTSLCYLYFTPISCIVYTVIFSVVGMYIRLILMDFMAQKSIQGYEATSFVTLCSVNNLTNTINLKVGSWLLPLFGLKYMIILNSLTSFLCLFLINKIGLRGKDEKEKIKM